MERVRPPRSSDNSALETIGPLPSTHSLNVLLDVVRSPGVMRTDVDALLQGLARPLGENESPRSRADLLLSIIESEEVGDLQGSDQFTVRDTAVKCLLDLGYPYALEIPPEALSGRRQAQDAALPQKIPVPGLIATLAGFIVQSVTVLPPTLDFLSRHSSSDKTLGWVVVGLLLGPTLLSVLGGALRMRNLQRLGLITMMLTGAVWLINLAFQLTTTQQPLTHMSTYMSLVAALGFLLGALFTRSPEWAAPDDEPQDEAPETES